MVTLSRTFNLDSVGSKTVDRTQQIEIYVDEKKSWFISFSRLKPVPVKEE